MDRDSDVQPDPYIDAIAAEHVSEFDDIDGAVAELHVQLDGSVTAEIRIPAHQD